MSKLVDKERNNVAKASAKPIEIVPTMEVRYVGQKPSGEYLGPPEKKFGVNLRRWLLASVVGGTWSSTWVHRAAGEGETVSKCQHLYAV